MPSTAPSASPGRNITRPKRVSRNGMAVGTISRAPPKSLSGSGRTYAEARKASIAMFTQVTQPKERRLLGEMFLSSSPLLLPLLLRPFLPAFALEAKPPLSSDAREMREQCWGHVRDPGREGERARRGEAPRVTGVRRAMVPRLVKSPGDLAKGVTRRHGAPCFPHHAVQDQHYHQSSSI